MSSVKVYDRSGAEAGAIECPDALLELSRGAQAVHDAVTAYRAAQRAGTASTLSKGEVAGSNRKPWRQKGTGRARAGLRQSPVWRGGAAAFGPKPRDYTKGLNKKVGRLAFRRALSDRINEGAVCVVDSFGLDAPKTKAFTGMLDALKLDRPLLMVVERAEGADAHAALSARNVIGVEVELASCVNVYQLVRYPRILASRAAFDVLQARLESGVKQ